MLDGKGEGRQGLYIFKIVINRGIQDMLAQTRIYHRVFTSLKSSPAPAFHCGVQIYRKVERIVKWSPMYIPLRFKLCLYFAMFIMYILCTMFSNKLFESKVQTP